MTTLVVTPLKSVGTIIFGESKEIVRAKLGGSFKEFRKTKSSVNPVDDFGWCHVYYDASGKVEAIEVFNDNNTVLSLDGTNLFSLDFADLAQILQQKDAAARCCPPDITSKKLGIAAYGETGKTETILVGAKGYVQ